MTLAVVSLGLPTFLAAPPASSLSIHARWPLPFSDSVLGPFSLPHLPSFRYTYSQLPADISTRMPHKPLQLSQSQMEATSCHHQCRAGNQLLCVWFSSRHRGLTNPWFLPPSALLHFHQVLSHELPPPALSLPPYWKHLCRCLLPRKPPPALLAGISLFVPHFYLGAPGSHICGPELACKQVGCY